MEFNLSLGSAEEEKRDYDVVIIGSGAAGLSAAIYCARSGLSAVVLDKTTPGGLTAEAPWVENYLGYKAISGVDLAKKFVEHASDYVTIRQDREVTGITRNKDGYEVQTREGVSYSCKGIIVATGTTHRHLNVPGEDKYYGKGVSYCSTCDGYLFRNKRVTVIGGGNSGAIAAITMSEYTSSTEVIEFMPRYMCEDAYVRAIERRKIPYLKNKQVTEIKGDGKKVTGLVMKDRQTGEVSEVETDGVFIYVGLIPQTSFLREAGVKLDERGYIITNAKGKTNLDMVYAAGDCVAGNEAQIATAVGDGCRAAINLYRDMVNSGR
ncbi:hypothetical protein GCM10007108_14870 [Thermogymnomonas acidicola]|uniref:FAD/NAD(P)-binding domain-containing protein n=1 Tax=Thermogymnomonas acidicola TaxID=399579 RepID=A0AA37BS99_9ARCH|nr:FAD-dependent oxidoreductase [Thermogymnomonas acidicola]GGM77751.1 hypothetical protein GCM10007108_14870 [Thermogymnomonas acidicola]